MKKQCFLRILEILIHDKRICNDCKMVIQELDDKEAKRIRKAFAMSKKIDIDDKRSSDC